MFRKKLVSFQFICSVSLLVFIVSCNEVEEETNIIQFEALPYSSELQSTEYSFDGEVNILNPGDIINVDDRYLIISDAEEDAIFKVFSLPELEYMYSWGSRGQGPDEFQYVPLNEINTSENKLIIYDIGSQNLYFYSVYDTSFVLEVNQTLSYDGQTNILTNITRLNENLYVADYGTTHEFTDYEYIALQPGDDTPRFRFGYYPQSDLEGPERYFEYIKTSVSSEHIGKFAAFYLNHNRFKLYDNEGNHMAEVQIDDDFLNNNRSNTESFQYRTVKWASHRYLYSMGIHGDRQEIEENIETFLTSLEVWNWKGEQIYRAKFDKPVHNFTVSEEHGKIYAYSIINSNVIYEFNIPDKIISN